MLRLLSIERNLKIMAKTGRPRRSEVERDARGKIARRVYRLSATDRQAARDAQAKDAQSVAIWRRLRELATTAALDQRLGSLIGQMFLVGIPRPIDEKQFEAGVRFSHVLLAYDRLVLGRVSQVQALDLARQRGVTLSEPSAELVRLAGTHMLSAMKALGARLIAGSDEPLSNGLPRIARSSLPNAAVAVMALCREEGGFGGCSPDDAFEGLTILANHYGLYDTRAERIQRWTAASKPADDTSKSLVDDGLCRQTEEEHLTEEAERE